MTDVQERHVIADPTVAPHVPEALVRDFDYKHDPAYTRDPFGYLMRYRDEGIFWSPADGGYWVVTKAELIREIVQDPEVFSNQYSLGGIPPARFWPRPGIPDELDPPEHREFRNALSPHFAPRAVVSLVPGARDFARNLLARVAKRGHCDLIRDFALPLPTQVFASWFGLPEEDWPRLEGWISDLVRKVPLEQRVASGGALAAYLIGFVDARWEQDNGDLFSEVLKARVFGRPLTREEALDTAYQLCLAGLDTVTESIGWAFHHLATHAELQETIAAEPALIPDVVEELLRQYSFISTSRYVTRDIDFHGVRMHAGDSVDVPTAYGSRDAAECPFPDQVDVTRKAIRQMAFGAGPHRCLGAHLARHELVIALEEWHAVIPSYRLSEASPVIRHGGGAPGFDSLPLVWATARS